MIHGKRLMVVMPACNDASTVGKTVADIPSGYVDEIILVDDSATATGKWACTPPRIRKTAAMEAIGGLGIRRPPNLVPGVVVMVHTDYQYTPKLVVAMASMIATGQYDIVLASRILSGSAIRGVKPVYKYVSNRLLTLFQNSLMYAKVPEVYTGYRAFSRDVLEKLPLGKNCDDFCL